jgi:hydrogenase maturation factor
VVQWRFVTREGNRVAQERLWRALRAVGGCWRGIAHVPNGNLAAVHQRRHHGGHRVAERVTVTPALTPEIEQGGLS